MSKRDWYWLSENDLSRTVGVCRWGTLPEFGWIWWCPGQKTVEGVDPLPCGIDLDAAFHDQAVFFDYEADLSLKAIEESLEAAYRRVFQHE